MTGKAFLKSRKSFLKEYSSSEKNDFKLAMSIGELAILMKHLA